MTQTVNELLRYYSELPDWAETTVVDVNTINKYGDYPINVAATRCRIDEVGTFLAAGADVNQAGEHLYTPLHSAVEQGCLELLIFLLRHGARTDCNNSNGLNALELADLMDEVQIADFLRERESS